MVNKRCTNATLEAFGIFPDEPVIHGTGVHSLLKEAGYQVKLPEWWFERNWDDLTLAQFMEAHPTGDYVICTANHSMALRNGVLTDTANGTGRRKIKYVLEVTMPEQQNQQEQKEADRDNMATEMVAQLTTQTTALQRLEEKDAYQTVKVFSGKYLVKDETNYIWSIRKEGKVWIIRSLLAHKDDIKGYASKKEAIAYLERHHSFIRSWVDPQSTDYKKREEKRAKVLGDDLKVNKEMGTYLNPDLVGSTQSGWLMSKCEGIFGIFAHHYPELEKPYTVSFSHRSNKDTVSKYVESFSTVQEGAVWLESRLTELTTIGQVEQP